MITKRKIFLQINDDDNLLVALQNLKKGTEIIHNGNRIILQDDIDAKHKFTTEAIRVLKKSPRWVPGQNNGNFLKSWREIPIKLSVD